MGCRYTKVAIIGGGPAGAVCAEYLARAGCDVTVFEGRVCWEKPCAGGLTPLLFDEFPWMHALDQNCTRADRARIELFDDKIEIELSRPIRMVTRADLARLLRGRTQSAGARWVDRFARTIEPAGPSVLVEGERFDCVVGADGASSSVRRRLSTPLSREDMALSSGLYVPARFQRGIVVRMLPQLCGYAWIFPRPDCTSVGVVGAYAATDGRELRREAERLARDYLPAAAVDAARPFGHPLPAVRGGLLLDDGLWSDRFALVGDAAGLCDQLTGEGIRWAMLSGKLAAEAIAAGEMRRYADALRKRVLPELALCGRYVSRILRRGPLRLAGLFGPRSSLLRRAIDDYLTGSLSYPNFKQRLIYPAPLFFGQLAVQFLFSKRK
ncbi:MAG: NAD(P)/FAD-dependent oxidoreductase [Candidatus Alcyoniella australis]|nr:NAD(P)/FAD-dependent oxidoreductase [Candidatus Alcyoniella australis]